MLESNIFSQIIITCEYIDGSVYNHSDYNSLDVIYIDAYFTNIDNFSNIYLVCFSDEGRIGNNGFDSSRNYSIFGVVYG